MITQKLRIVLSLFLALFIGTMAHAQHMYGYKGKRLYVSYDLSGSLSLLRYDTDGDYNFPTFNVFHNFSLNYVTNKSTAMGLDYKFYRDVASISDGTEITPIPGPGSGANFLSHQQFYSNEVGLHISWFTSDLNAPLGKYVSLGLGMVVSNFQSGFKVSSYDEDYLRSLDPSHPDFPDPDNVFVYYDNTRPIISPIIRTSLGAQQLFYDRFFVNASMDFGFNLGIFSALASTATDPLAFGGTVVTTESLDSRTRATVQQRVFFRNLLTFKIGGGILLF